MARVRGDKLAMLFGIVTLLFFDTEKSMVPVNSQHPLSFAADSFCTTTAGVTLEENVMFRKLTDTPCRIRTPSCNLQQEPHKCRLGNGEARHNVAGEWCF